METQTIRISTELKKKLDSFKMLDSETYEDIIWEFIEDKLELSPKIKNKLEEFETEKNKGTLKTISFEELKNKVNKKNGLQD